MLSLVTRFFRLAVITAGLGSLAIVLAPTYTAPLWDWARTIGGLVGNDPLPSFGVTQHWSALTLVTFVVSGIAYNLWRDRRHHVLRAEYDYRTGASHLKEKVADLQAQLRRATAERDKWQESYLSLTRKHTDTLVTAKEHEVRSELGRSDHEALDALRKELDALVQARGHIEGFREAMQFFLANLSEPGQAPAVAIEATANGSSRGKPGKDQRPALPCKLPTRT
jgi:hypothetical protein